MRLDSGGVWQRSRLSPLLRNEKYDKSSPKNKYPLHIAMFTQKLRNNTLFDIVSVPGCFNPSEKE